ncbi:MAG TPA: hypothetical protein VK658_05355 [Chryseolinea sp.]|nr:hypothetical protein [Chryseolinea sp.]
MIRSYLKVAYRHVLSNKFLSLINISGLGVGLAAFVLIIQYVGFAISYDDFHANKEQIYRVAYKQYRNGELQNTSAKNFIGIPSLIKEHFPESGP